MKMIKSLLVASAMLAITAVAANAGYCNDQAGKPINAAACSEHRAYSAALLPSQDTATPVYMRDFDGNVTRS